MTDEEIIEALDLCTQQNGSIPCYDCPCWNYGEQKCEGIDYTATLDLINRQKAEIERLTKQMEWLTGYNSNLIDANTALSGEIELLKEAEEAGKEECE